MQLSSYSLKQLKHPTKLQSSNVLTSATRRPPVGGWRSHTGTE